MMPPLADFIFAFSLFFLLGVISIYIIPRIKPLSLLIIFLAIYTVGYIFYFQLNGVEAIVPIKSILVGHGGLHRFPLFQYAIVYIVGILYTKYYKKVSIAKLASLLLLLSPLAAIMIYFTGLERWIASPGFMLYGLVAITALLLIFKLFKSLKSAEWLYMTLSRRTSGILIVHILIVVGVNKFITERYAPPELIILTLVVLYISWWAGKWIKV